MVRRRAWLVATVIAVLGGVLAPAAAASEGGRVAAVGVLDALNRTESKLSNGGKWSALGWSGGTAPTGQDTTSGWGPSDAFSTVNGAYWNSSTFSDAKGDASGLTLNSSPSIEERYVAVWLNMPEPATAKSGYQLRWRLNKGLTTYTVTLAKWAAGTETVLASNASVSIASGTRLMLSDTGGTVTAWKGSGSALSSLLTASDSTYSSGYAGIEGSGNISRSLDFRAGALPGPIYWGAWMGGNAYPAEEELGDAPWEAETWNRFESHAGKQLSLVHFGQPAPWDQAFAAGPLELVKERGAIPVVDMGNGEATLAEIANGSRDAYLTEWAEDAAEYESPFFLRWDFQMNGTWFPWGEEAAENPTRFKEAWQHFHNVVEAAGATNVTWVWCPNTSYEGSTSLSSLYPGNAYVDWTCMDSFNSGTNPIQPNGWESFSTLFSTTYGELQSLASSKPIMIGETASSEYGGSKASWIGDAFETQLPVSFPAVKAVMWWNKTDGGLDWPIESSESAQTAFANAIASGYYAKNEFGSPPLLTPVEPIGTGSAPAAPSVTTVLPATVANDNTPIIKGTAASGSTVHLYTNKACSGSPVGNARAANFESTGIEVGVADDTTTSFYANASNWSGFSSCSATSVTYTEDSTPPAAPTVSSTSPASPANNNSPKVIGSAEAGSTVKLFATAGCTGSPLASGTASSFASPGIAASVSDNTTTTFRATATDAAGNVSPCSSTSVAYVEDSNAPPAPTVSSTSPASGSNNNSPKVIGSAESGSTVKLYPTASCTGSAAATGTAASFASPGLTVSVSDNTTTTFKATATDAAGNTSSCSSSSVTYKEVSPKVYWGAWISGNVPEEEVGGEWGDAPWDSETWNRFETHTGGKHVSLLHFGQPPPWSGEPFYPGVNELIRERGALPVMDMSTSGATLKQIAEGKKDESIKTWAKSVAKYEYPFFFRLDWEMNGTWFQWGEEAAENPTRFKGAWQHFHKVVVEAGATNVTWVWCPNTSYEGSTSLSSLYPGDEYVDWTCIDGYNFGTNPVEPAGWTSFSSLFSTTYGELLSLAPSKPIMIGETASSEYGGSKSSWISDAFETQLPANFPAIRGVMWFNKYESGEDWPIETSESAKNAFASAIASPYYVENEFKNPTKLKPIQPLP